MRLKRPVTVKAVLIRAFVCTAVYFASLMFLLTRPTDTWDWTVFVAITIAIPSCFMGMDAWYKLWTNRNA